MLSKSPCTLRQLVLGYLPTISEIISFKTDKLVTEDIRSSFFLLASFYWLEKFVLLIIKLKIIHNGLANVSIQSFSTNEEKLCVADVNLHFSIFSINLEIVTPEVAEYFNKPIDFLYSIWRYFIRFSESTLFYYNIISAIAFLIRQL